MRGIGKVVPLRIRLMLPKQAQQATVDKIGKALAVTLNALGPPPAAHRVALTRDVGTFNLCPFFTVHLVNGCRAL